MKEAVKVSTQEEWDYVVDKLGFKESKNPCHKFEGHERYLRLNTFWYNHTFDYYQERGYTLIPLEEFKSRYEPTLKIGDTFEYEGFICEVKEKIKIWVYDTYQEAYYKVDTIESEYCKEITDQGFIEQLEKHSLAQ